MAYIEAIGLVLCPNKKCNELPALCSLFGRAIAIDWAWLRINFKSFFRLYVFASLHVVNEKDKFLITLAENKKLFTIFGELCTCLPQVEQAQPFATMGADVLL